MSLLVMKNLKQQQQQKEQKILTRTLMTGIRGNNSFRCDSIITPCNKSHRAPSI